MILVLPQEGPRTWTRVRAVGEALPGDPSKLPCYPRGLSAVETTGNNGRLLRNSWGRMRSGGSGAGAGRFDCEDGMSGGE